MRLLPVVLIALPLFAQSTDVSVQIFGPARVPQGQGIAYSIPYETAPGATLEIDLPGTILDGYGSGGPGVRCEIGKPIRCTFAEEAQRFGAFNFLVQAGPGTHTATARISAGSASDTASVTTEVVAAPSLIIDPGAFLPQVSPREAITLNVAVRNNGTVPANNVVFTVSLPAGGAITGVSVGSNRTDVACSHTETTLICTIPQLPHDVVFFGIQLTAPNRVEGAPFTVNASVRSDEPDFGPLDNERTFFILMKRELLVTNTNDSGDGSLRTAMLDANLCVRRTPCNISFRIPGPVPQGGRFVIRPLTPLPELVGEVKVDGRTQTLLTGDTNPDGPEIEIDGSLLTEGAGIRLSPNCNGEIYDLAVTNFPGHGIDVSRMPNDPAPEACYVNGPTIRVTIARNHLIGNLRGLGIRSFFTTVEDNVIRGNRRSGIFAGDGSYLTIARNRVESNGASGIFVNVDQATIERNVIADNEHWAVARTPRGDVMVSANSMVGNVLQGIDIGLDFDTPANRPVLFWAIYDPARRVTVVRGRFDPVNPPAYTRLYVELFASSALSRANQPQAERPLTEHELTPRGGELEIVVPEDLRGQWITAASHTLRLSLFFGGSPRTETHDAPAPGYTSELSNAVFVAP